MAQSNPSPWREEANYVVHSMAGAFLFGAPFLYTMEVWWRGNTSRPERMLATVALTFLALVVIERAANLRSGRNPPWVRSVTEAAQAQAIGLVAAAVGLALIGEATLEDGVHAFVGRVVFEGFPFGIGVGLADFILGEAGGRIPKDPSKDNPQKAPPTFRNILIRLAATLLGATVLAATLAPTDEIPLITSDLSHANLLALVFASLVISYAIVFSSTVVTGKADEAHGDPFESPLAETVTAYVVSLAAATTLLWVFDLVHLGDPVEKWVSYIVVLGLPASIGGAAGRLVL